MNADEVLVIVSRQDSVGVITINNPPVNALSPGVPEGITTGLKKLQDDRSIKEIVLIGGGKTFIAGAEMKELGKITSGQTHRLEAMRDMLASLEDASKPVVAGIHGTAFGGGLETAM